MVPIEVQASCRPVIALARGGALETVEPGRTGILYDDDSADGLAAAVRTFEASDLSTRCRADCIANAARFDHTAFRAGMVALLRAHGLAPAGRAPAREA